MSKSTYSKKFLMAFAGLSFWMHQTHADAHFLFIRIGEHAEAGRAAELFFSERAAAGDPRFIDKIAGTQLWVQQEPGQWLPLKATRGADRLRAHLPSSGAVAVSGYCEYGVVERDVPFLLRYYPKSISGTEAEVNQFLPNQNTELQITASVSGDSITLVLLDHGKPVPHATFTTIDDALVNEELKADAEGRATLKPTSRGHYCVYSKVVRNVAGELAGKAYREIREFPTLAFQWPLSRTDGDAEAVELFEKAIASRANWQDFPGFSAQIEGVYDGRPFAGTLRADQEGAIALKIDQEVATEWVDDQLRSLVMHRLAPRQRSTPVIRFADEDTKHPLGRLLTFVGGRFASSYRVKDDQLMTVNRNLGQENMTITVLENDKTPEGKYLPHLYTVQYWAAAEGNLLRTETFENRWKRIGSFDLPALNTVMTSSAAGLSVRSFRISQHELLKTN